MFPPPKLRVFPTARAPEPSARILEIAARMRAPSPRKPRIVPIAPAPEPSAQILALIARMRALSVADEELAKLIAELEADLPKARVTEIT